MASFETSDLKKIGLGFIGFGVMFTMLGVFLFLDKGFLTIGNILFLSGVILTVGPKSALQFLLKPKNYKASVSLGVGFLFVITGWPIIGMIGETYGFIVLFSGFWPSLSVYMRRSPIIGWLLRQSYAPKHFNRSTMRRVPV